LVVFNSVIYILTQYLTFVVILSGCHLKIR
jgi:hypothetical protein